MKIEDIKVGSIEYSSDWRAAEAAPEQLIDEGTEPHPAESWEVDKKILVKSNTVPWTERHFAKYEDGKVYAFCDGRTSWTSSKAPLLTHWEFAKLPEGDS